MRRPPSSRRRLLCVWILAWLACAPAAAAPLAEARNLAEDAQTMREKRIPMVVLFSRGGCHWCEKVRREHLAPLADDGVLLREVHTDRNAPLTDFAGRAGSHRTFAREQRARLTPTLMFFGPDGRQLAEPIVGYRLPDFYGAYVDDAIEHSRQKLRSSPESETP